MARLAQAQTVVDIPTGKEIMRSPPADRPGYNGSCGLPVDTKLRVRSGFLLDQAHDPDKDDGADGSGDQLRYQPQRNESE